MFDHFSHFSCSHVDFFCLQVYYEPMLKLDILTESELGQIFGTLDSLIPLHEGKSSLFFAYSRPLSQSPISRGYSFPFLIVYMKLHESGNN